MKKHNLLVLAYLSLSILFWNCSSDDPEPPVDCAATNLQLSLDENKATTGCDQADGSLTVSAQGGTGNINFSINGTDFQGTGVFTGLQAGNYTITARDENNCEVTLDASVGVEGITLAISNIATNTSGCNTSNGTITVSATGQGQIMYKLDQAAFQTSNTFGNLAAGTYEVVVKDESNCEISSEAKILSGVSYSQQVQSIINANCAISGCHNGDNGSSRDWTVFSNVQSSASNIKSRTQSGSMPPAGSGRTLTQQQKDLIACWVDDGALDN